MTWILLIALLVVIFALLLLKKQNTHTGSISFPYQRGKSLFSEAERSFLGVLDQAVGADYRVFGKVRLADVAAVKSGLTNSARQGAFNRIAYKHFDYVVCRAGDLSMVCAVELNDKSHTSRKAQDRDEFVANVCRVIALPLLIVPAKAAYSPEEVRTQFLAAIAVNPASNRIDS
ncbi:MAG: DUF2726 domain-containing protein [Oxalicibacterium faecigallinarum]|uniref:DUF2726 domain-containing protein n=1 Tax=Oxalicibacterium faecigallinarum TaxID=573741 RepID=UPI002809FD80|nr:DUF2726 domain-containing protein [Oxalicibacterium faecigallinarum]MDQ7969585.1 DUF2726 domain-containing protein [Oxalicibacterium faecigallinarum]